MKAIMKAGARFLLPLLLILSMPLHAAASSPADRQQVLEAMKRATTFMTDKVAYKGGYVWSYLPDLSRRWGEMEARETMIWLQPPGTSSMGHVFLDAYHVTGDEYYYRAAEQVGAALIWGQHPSGGWNYVVDFGGDRSLRDWYATVGRNAWRLEEFQHYYGNATFDDDVTADAAKFLLRLYVEKHDPRYKPALDQAIKFVLDSQYPIGGWPQRYPLSEEFSKHGRPDYTSFLTFNDDVSAQNVHFLIFCYEALGERRLLDPITRGMNFFLSSQQGPPQPGWALQYSLDVRPAGARSYEPLALATHTTATNIGHMISFYELTGDSKYLARVPEALDWLQSLQLPKKQGDKDERATLPTFIELATNKPLYVHRRGSNAINGEYYVDYDSRRTPSHYSSTRRADIVGLRKRYEAVKARSVQELTKQSPLFPGTDATELPRLFATVYEPVPPGDIQSLTTTALGSLNETGYWPAALRMTSHPYHGDGSKQATKGDFASTHVGDETDTSPYPDPNPVMGISTAEYMKNMNVLIQWLETAVR